MSENEHDPVDEMTGVLLQVLSMNALRLTTSRGGYVGGGQPHATIDSDLRDIEAVARGLLARKVAEPSRSLTSQADDPSGPDATEPCPTCMQPVPVPQLGDHDYGLSLHAATPERALGELLTSVEYLCEEHGQNAILIDDLRAVVAEAILALRESPDGEQADDPSGPAWSQSEMASAGQGHFAGTPIDDPEGREEAAFDRFLANVDVDAAWADMVAELPWHADPERPQEVVARHRPLIEGALRAEREVHVLCPVCGGQYSDLPGHRAHAHPGPS